MRPLLMLGALVVPLILILPSTVAAEVPDLIPSSKPERAEPLWRSAAMLEDAQGIRWDLFNDYERQELRLKMAESDAKQDQQPDASARRGPLCVSYGPVVAEGTTFHSLGANLARSAAVYTGTLVGYKQGFLARHPGSLYEVAVDDNLMPGGAPKRVFVYYPAAAFVLDGHRICKSGLRGDERPRVGGGILVFSSTRASNVNPVILPSDSDLFFDAEDGRLSVPPALRDLEGIRDLPLADIEEQVRAAIEQPEVDTEGPLTPRTQNRNQRGRP